MEHSLQKQVLNQLENLTFLLSLSAKGDLNHDFHPSSKYPMHTFPSHPKPKNNVGVSKFRKIKKKLKIENFSILKNCLFWRFNAICMVCPKGQKLGSIEKLQVCILSWKIYESNDPVFQKKSHFESKQTHMSLKFSNSQYPHKQCRFRFIPSLSQFQLELLNSESISTSLGQK